VKNWEAKFEQLEQRITAAQTPLAESTRVEARSPTPDPEPAPPASPAQDPQGLDQAAPSADRIPPQGPPIRPDQLEVADAASVISGPEQSRADKWNAVTTAVKEFLPNIPVSVPTPIKKKKLPDPADPEPRDPTVRMPLHRDILEACNLIRQDVLAAANNPQKKQHVRVKPDRSAPARFFKPEGAGHILEPAEIEQNFKDLHYRPDQLAPYQASQTEEDLIEDPSFYPVHTQCTQMD